MQKRVLNDMHKLITMSRQLTICVLALSAVFIIPVRFVLAADIQTPINVESGIGPTINGRAIHLGDTLSDVRSVLGHDVKLEHADPPDMEAITHFQRMIVYDPKAGVKIWFSQSGNVKAIYAIRGFGGQWNGISIGDDTASIEAKLGEPTRRATIQGFVPIRYIYQHIDGGFIIDFGKDGRVFSMTISSGQWGL
jgi:hypothetical protein